ncbi:MAG: nucleoside-diphosphate kinase [Candidatus Pacearchaeota archaeon]|nr:nucleoside-diphosphate kinase [Candidatus Pacearchaeota archaeon]
MIQRTLVLLKPDAIKRGLVGRILQRFEDAGLKIVAMKMQWIEKKHAEKHYEDLGKRRGEEIKKRMVDFLTLGPVIALVLEGIEAVEVVRKIVGGTEPKTAPPGTIRGDFAHLSIEYSNKKSKAVPNLIHASDSVENAKKEIALWFNKKEIHDYKTIHEEFVF